MRDGEQPTNVYPDDVSIAWNPTIWSKHVRAAEKGRAVDPNLRPSCIECGASCGAAMCHCRSLCDRSVPCVAAGVGPRASRHAAIVALDVPKQVSVAVHGRGGLWYSNTDNCIFIQYRQGWISPERTAVVTAQERLLRQHDVRRKPAPFETRKERNVLSLAGAIATAMLIFLSPFLA